MGVYRTCAIPVLQYEGQEAADHNSKVETLVKAFKSVHSSGNICPDSKSRMEEKLNKQHFKLEYNNNDNEHGVNYLLQELKQAIQKGEIQHLEEMV